MDGVQVYSIVMLTLSMVLGMLKHGDPRRGNYSFTETLINFVLGAPVWGRIFGWW